MDSFQPPQSSEIPLPHPEREPTKAPRPVVRENLFQRLDFLESDIMEGTSFHNGSKKRSGLKLALWTWFSAGIDGLILVSMSCFFLVLSSFMMKASPQSMLSLFFKDQSFIFSMGILFVLSLWTYLIFMRAFIGASVGEWTCDLRLGEPLQRFQFSYVFKVIVRTTLILMTGVLVLPLISLILSRDLAGEISGLKIYSLE